MSTTANTAASLGETAGARTTIPAAAPAALDGTAAGGPAVPLGEGETMTRRTFQGYVAASLASFMGLVVGLPVVGYLAAPLASTAKAMWLSLGRVDAFKPGDPKLVSLSVTRQDGWRQITEARTCWVVAQDANKFTAFNGRCTHLGCAYSWRTEGEHANRFFCPCHEGVYDASGTVVAGPPPRPLDRMEVKVDGGELLVLYQDFRLGTSSQEPA